MLTAIMCVEVLKLSLVGCLYETAFIHSLQIRGNYKYCFNPYKRLRIFAYEYFILFGRVTSPSAKPSFLEDQFVSLSLASHKTLQTNSKNLFIY